MPESTNRYHADIKVTVQGQALAQDVLNNILQLVVEESLHLPSMVTLIVKNDATATSFDQPWQHEDKFKIGHTVEIEFSSSTTFSGDSSQKKSHSIFKGEITGIETHFTSGTQAPIIIRGYDISHRLHRGRYNRSFQNMTDSDIVKKVAQELGLSLGTIDSSGKAHVYVFQENQTPMEFLRERACRIGFELFVRDGKLYFRKPKKDQDLTLQWLKNLESFQIRMTSSEQVQAVEVRGWNYEKKQAIAEIKQSGESLTGNEYSPGQKASHPFQQGSTDPKLIVVDQPCSTEAVAGNLAQALFNEIEDQFIQADGRTPGNPELRAGCRIKLEGLGKYNGHYYVTDTRHCLSDRDYKTEFMVRGLRGGSIVSQAIQPTSLQPGQTLLIGIVTNNNDPNGWGRVRVRLPTLADNDESDWARVVTLGAGNQRGLDCLPEINDEVLVGFEHGDIHRPFVLGSVWNGIDKPAESVNQSVVDNKVRLRTLTTRTGHTLQFVEEDQGSSKRGIRMTTTAGHQLYLNDSDQVIEVKTPGGHRLKLDDRSQQIEIKSTSGHSFVLNDSGNRIELKSVGSLSIQATTNLTLQAGANLTIKGAMIHLN